MEIKTNAVVAKGYYNGEKIIPCEVICIPIEEGTTLPSTGEERGRVIDGVFYPKGRVTHFIYPFQDLLCCWRDPNTGEVQKEVSFLSRDNSIPKTKGMPIVTLENEKGTIRAHT